MNKSTAVLVASLLLGLICAALIIRLWQENFGETARVRPPPAPAHSRTAAALPARPLAAEPPAEPDPRALALLAALERAFLRGDARSREVVLTFKDDDALRRFLERASQGGLTVTGRLDRLRSVRVSFDSFGAVQNELLEHAGDHAESGANTIVSLPRAPSREERAAQDHVPFGNDTLAFLGANGDRSNWGRGTTIAILDTGVAADATFGVGRVRAVDIGLGVAPASSEEGGHGTAVAALAAGASPDAPGVAPAANLVSIRVTDASGLSDLFTISQAILAAVDAGARIINVSMGGYATGSVLDRAIDYATQHGAIIVAAAGNDQAAQLTWPAADPRVISVGAVDKAEQQVSFSNSGAQLQLTAPGYGVQTAWLNGQRVYVDGTSASAPLVAGAIAALMSQNSSLAPRQAADLLARTANDGGQAGADPAFGRGIVNLGTAMNSGNLGYIDTAVSSHYYDAANNQLQITVQNRSGRTVSGMTLNASIAGANVKWTVPALSAGETFVARAPADAGALQRSGRIQYATQLVNPPGVIDVVPANNQRSSVLTAPAPAGKP